MGKNALLSLLGFAFCFVSCATDNLYSCDPEVETWTRSNLSQIQNMKPIEFSKLDHRCQRGAYEAFSSAQRRQIWLRKIDQILTLDWNQQERQHIQKLRILIETHPSLFDKSRNSNTQDDVIVEAYKWVEYGKAQLNWTPQLMYWLVGDPNNVIKQKDAVGNVNIVLASNLSVQSTLSATRSEDNDNDCDCHATESNLFLCSYKDCIDREISKCDFTSWGCGILWIAPCHGKCKK